MIKSIKIYRATCDECGQITESHEFFFEKIRSVKDMKKAIAKRGWTEKLCPSCNPKSLYHTNGEAKNPFRIQENTISNDDPNVFDVMKHHMEGKAQC